MKTGSSGVGVTIGKSGASVSKAISSGISSSVVVVVILGVVVVVVVVDVDVARGLG